MVEFPGDTGFLQSFEHQPDVKPMVTQIMAQPAIADADIHVQHRYDTIIHTSVNQSITKLLG